MTKRPEVIDFILQNGFSFLEQAKPFPEFSGPVPCAETPELFSQVADLDDAEFFGESSISAMQQNALFRQAKTVCATCPFMASCLDWAISNDEYGVWGGTTKAERLERQVAPQLTQEAAIRLQEEYRFITDAPVGEICRAYSAVPRTVARWRKIVAHT